MAVHNALPREVQAAIARCDYLIDITRVPLGFDWPQLVARIEALRSFADAKRLDRWLLQCGLRDRR